MKNLFFLFLCFGTFHVYAQDQYTTINNIQYYPDSVNQKDSYMASQCRLDVYYPKSKKNFATVVWFHAGSLTEGKKEIPSALMEKGYAVVGVEYRLAPLVSAPKYIEDAAASIAWVFKNIERYGGSQNLIFVSGHSAGGYLGLMAVLDKKYLNKHNIDPNKIAGLIPFSGQAITHFTIRRERNIKDYQSVVDAFAPLFHVREETPPILLITGDRELELFGRYEENAYLNRMMKVAGNKRVKLYELQGFDHGNMPEGAFPILLRELESIIGMKREKK
jgi:acetyl esterase/lipase